MHNKKFINLSVAVAVSNALINAQAIAQEPNETEIILVKGIKSSLVKAIDTKREARGVVDSISAEDIGKFPDQNVAESLQRIPGVAIDRSGGEGQRITVRGFGPEFNNVLVNGRTMATENQERDFSFDTLASELISGTEVYKTYSADMTDGGIGSTVNLITARPFDISGSKFVFSAKALHEELSGKTTPQFSGLASGTFADDTLGLLISFSHQERKARVDQVNTRGFLNDVDLSHVGGATSSFVQQTNDQIVDFQDRTRTGGTVVLQYAPSEDLTITADALYSDFNVESDATSIGHWMTMSELSDITVDANGTVTQLTHSDNGATDFVARSFNRPTSTKGFGLNAEWKISDKLEMQFDISESSAKSDNGGNDIFAVIGFNNSISSTNNSGIIKVTGIPELSPSLGRAHLANREGLKIEDDVSEIKVDGSYFIELGPLTSINFGVASLDREKANTSYGTNSSVLCLYCGYPIDVPDNLLTSFTPDGFMSGEDTDGVPTSWLRFDGDAYFDYLESDEAASARDQALNLEPGTTRAILDANNGFSPQRQADSFAIEESVLAAYVDLAFDGELADMFWRANFGLRYTETDMTAKGRQIALLALEEIPNDETLLTAVFTENEIAVNKTNSYSNLLPAFNFQLDITDDLIGRFAYSQTITRPTMRTLAPRTSYDVLSPGALRASSGNPEIDLYESTNFDLSLEWYFSDVSYVSAAYFRKSVDNFIVTGIRKEIFKNPNTGEDITEPDGSEALWDVAGFVNSPETLSVDGLELSYQQTFDMLPGIFSGLGVFANMTIVDSDTEIDVNNLEESFALTGLGDSRNFVVFYEKDALQMRVALNQRDEFLQTLRNPTGGDPIFVEDYSQVDMSASYDVSENITIFLEGLNVTGEKVKSKGRFDNHFVSLVDSGARYTFGIRASY
ncbi:TonB-dependent receptor [Catenovulum agarivorans]|uniref:TonB-dependent receptor n=1 Tax=Catenovulum agarivorans TaxID=1172192 RepID=UPI000318B0C3|nr:TonB-dependent receptor [Catenovulum agarivorans]